jgi:hypothetical protein
VVINRRKNTLAFDGVGAEAAKLDIGRKVSGGGTVANSQLAIIGSHRDDRPGKGDP